LPEKPQEETAVSLIDSLPARTYLLAIPQIFTSPRKTVECLINELALKEKSPLTFCLKPSEGCSAQTFLAQIPTFFRGRA